MDYIEEIQKNILFGEGRSMIEQAFHDVYFYGPLSNKELSRRTMLPIPVVTALKKECIKSGLWEQAPRQGVRMTDRGKHCFEKDFDYSGIDKELYLRLLNNKDAKEELVHQLSKKYCLDFLDRPRVDVTIDQAQCTVQTAFRRALLCLCNGTLIGKKILCLGDDDFVSVALGLLLKRLFSGKERLHTDICMLDMDERYISCIRRLAERYGLPIRCECTDFRQPLPGHLLGYFDCVFTDPPYTQEGASLFLSRGVSALKPQRGLNLFFSFANKPVNETYALQQCILLHGLSVREIYLQFNEYEGASLLGNRGQLFVLETTDRTRAVVPAGREGRKDIYTAQHKTGASGHLPSGIHILADFHDCQSDVLDDETLVGNYMHEAALKSGAHIVEERFHKFSPQGVSGVIVIEESHLTIHTWPEYRYAAIDLFTCGRRIDPWAAFDCLKERLKCGNMEYRDMSRGFRNSNI